jgi:hypothetical protein
LNSNLFEREMGYKLMEKILKKHSCEYNVGEKKPLKKHIFEKKQFHVSLLENRLNRF